MMTTNFMKGELLPWTMTSDPDSWGAETGQVTGCLDLTSDRRYGFYESSRLIESPPMGPRLSKHRAARVQRQKARRR